MLFTVHKYGSVCWSPAPTCSCRSSQRSTMGWLALREDRVVSLWNSLWLDHVPASRGRLRYVSMPLACTQNNYHYWSEKRSVSVWNQIQIPSDFSVASDIHRSPWPQRRTFLSRLLVSEWRGFKKPAVVDHRVGFFLEGSSSVWARGSMTLTGPFIVNNAGSLLRRTWSGMSVTKRRTQWNDLRYEMVAWWQSS